MFLVVVMMKLFQSSLVHYLLSLLLDSPGSGLGGGWDREHGLSMEKKIRLKNWV